MKVSRDILETVYVLHARTYRETSLIAEVYSRHRGRLSVIFKGIRSRKSRISIMVQPFVPISLSLFGKSDLKTVANLEFPEKPFAISGKNLFLGMYVNELLYRLLEKFDPLESVFDSYECLLKKFENLDDPISSLRKFELNLLKELGYGINFQTDAASGEVFSPDAYYNFFVNEGFRKTLEPDEMSFRGDEIQSMALGKLYQVRPKKVLFLTRRSLARLLDHAPLTSRTIFSGLIE
ncbi:DNA repair protein RecO [Gammaproteobacteria bacterium]|nr:DNA repair protein RecO [Gammaproteobacteria bacterium]